MSGKDPRGTGNKGTEDNKDETTDAGKIAPRGTGNRGTDDDDDAERLTYANKRTETMGSGHGPEGGSTEEARIREKYGKRIFVYNIKNKKLEAAVPSRPDGDWKTRVKVGITPNGVLEWISGSEELYDEDVDTLKSKLLEEKKIRVGRVALKLRPKPPILRAVPKIKPGRYKAYSDVRVPGIAAAGMAAAGGLMAAFEKLDFPEQIDHYKAKGIDPFLIQRALSRYRHEHYKNGIKNLMIIHEGGANTRVPTNVLINPSTGMLYVVVLESTRDYDVGQVLEVDRLILHDKVGAYNAFRDYRTRMAYYHHPEFGYVALPF